MFDVRGFGWVWVGLGNGSISSPCSGLGWVGSVIWWVGLGWVDENRPTDNSVMIRLMLSDFQSIMPAQLNVSHIMSPSEDFLKDDLP